MDADAERFHTGNVMHNTNALYYIKSTTACVTGIYAGLLGLTNWSGFICYVITYLLVSALTWLVRCQSTSKRYFVNQQRDVWSSGFLDNLFSFVLFWTFGFALVHIYD